jgi:hypothetical protein
MRAKTVRGASDCNDRFGVFPLSPSIDVPLLDGPLP